MPLKPEVLVRLLLSKFFLDKIRFQPVALPDRRTLAANIIAAHEAAELLRPSATSLAVCRRKVPHT